MPKFEVYVDGIMSVVIEESSKEEALEKVAGWNGLSVMEIEP